jgi:signal transduction histidine kinase
MKHTRKTKIYHKFLLFILPLVIFSITITTGVLTWINFDHFRETIALDYQNILNSSIGEISTFMAHGIKDLDALSQIIASIKPDQWQQEIALSAFHHIHECYLSISLVSPTGKTITSTGWDDDDLISSQQALTKQAMEGESCISEVQLSKERLPFVMMAVPVKVLGEVTAILYAVVDLKYVWDILEGIRIGKSGQVYIMDLSGRYIAHRDIDKVLMRPPDKMMDIVHKIRHSDKPVSWLEKSEGTSFYSLGTYIPALDWVVALHQPTREIYYYLFRNIITAAMITTTACLTTMILGWYYVKKFLAPIHSLHRQVLEIGSGHLERGVAVDATDEIGELAMAFNGMTKALREKIRKEVQAAQELTHAQNLAVLGTTAGKVTHEVGNLLNNVGISAAALRDERLSPTGIEVLGTMEKESQRVKRFIHRFLKFAKPPKLQLKPAALDLILGEALAMHKPTAENHGIAFSFVWPTNVRKVPVDAQLIYQAFNNIIKNSIEAMKDGGILTIAGKMEKTLIKISLQDNGPGISQEHQEHIFAPFYTTKGKKGTGLGMAIVKSTVTAHRGTITCQSQPDQGACFLITLPVL